MMRDLSTIRRHGRILLAGALVLGCLLPGCAAVHPADPGLKCADGVLFTDVTAEPEGVEAPARDQDRGPAPEVSTGPDLADVHATGFRRRVLAQQRVLRAGTVSLPGLAAAWAAAPVGSHRAQTLAFLIEYVQRRLPPERLVRELSDYSGIRRRAAVRAATAHGADMVPALLTLITHHDPEVRREVVVALRSITDRHPSASGRGPVHAIRVWRAWYDAMRSRQVERPAPGPTPRPPVRGGRPLAVSM